MIRIKRCDIFAYAIVLFPICGVLQGVFSYYDEVIGLIAMMYALIKLYERKLYRTDAIIVWLLLAITVIGVASNLLSRLIDDMFAVAVDVLWLWKVYACYVMFRTICHDQQKRARIISVLSGFAKFAILLTFVTALVGQVADIGVEGLNGTVVFGIKQYGFFWQNSIHTGMLLFSCFMILAASPITNKQFYAYLMLAMVPLAITFSSLNYCWLAAMIVLMLILNKSSVIKFRYLGVLALGFLLVMMADMEAYLNTDAVRMIWWKYGIVTANSYFPFGSGFATYGSDMAARNYSKLYTLYGWERDHPWALGRNGRMLNDNFLAGILGEVGWLGMALYLCIVGVLIKVLNSTVFDKRTRIAVFATIITVAISMVGSAAVKSMMGVCTFSVIGILAGAIKEDKKKERAESHLMGR